MGMNGDLADMILGEREREEEWREVVERVVVFGRTNPEQKGMVV